MKTSPDEPVLFKKTGFVATITLNNPPHNPLGLATIDQLEELLTELASDDSVRVVVLTGAGDRTFSVGANIKEFGTGIEKMGLKDFIGQRLRVADLIESLPKRWFAQFVAPAWGVAWNLLWHAISA